MAVLDGKGAVVTGGSRGIGRAIVRRLAADGATVVFSFLENKEAAAEVTAEVAAAGGMAHAVQADQGSVAAVAQLFDEASRRLPGLDIVVCNASTSMPKPIEDVTEDDFDREMATDVKGPFFIIQHAGRMLRDGGRFVAISTMSTRLHHPAIALYTGAKGALENFTKVAALAYGARGITANIVSPGATRTQSLVDANPGDDFSETIEMTALRRLGEPEDIAAVVAFLAGPDGTWITGQNIPADGGILP
ncbi:MAG: SDR family oxidoreductase [Streptosporangiaceae bacterium]|nr:SDR family oxidoreductase [Streptosporangiaceae bacterium]